MTLEFNKKLEELANKMVGTDLQSKMVQDSLLVGIVIIDFEWRYLYVNEAIATRRKLTKAELIGKTIMEDYPGFERTDVFKAFEECMQKRVPVHLENEFEYLDKSKRWLELFIDPIEQGVFILSLDITERKGLERKLK